MGCRANGRDAMTTYRSVCTKMKSFGFRTSFWKVSCGRVTHPITVARTLGVHWIHEIWNMMAWIMDQVQLCATATLWSYREHSFLVTVLLHNWGEKLWPENENSHSLTFDVVRLKVQGRNLVNFSQDGLPCHVIKRVLKVTITTYPARSRSSFFYLQPVDQAQCLSTSRQHFSFWAMIFLRWGPAIAVFCILKAWRWPLLVWAVNGHCPTAVMSFRPCQDKYDFTYRVLPLSPSDCHPLTCSACKSCHGDASHLWWLFVTVIHRIGTASCNSQSQFNVHSSLSVALEADMSSLTLRSHFWAMIMWQFSRYFSTSMCYMWWWQISWW